jgi:hypothetical protein
MKILFLFFVFASYAPVLAQTKELKSSEIQKLLPQKIKGYHPNGEANSRQMKVGNITYTLCEKNFMNRKKSIKLLLFDFKNAEIMYQQAMNTWTDLEPIESDSVIMRAMSIANCTGWESFRKKSGKSQISLGIFNRFFLSMVGDNVDLESLKAVLNQVPLEKFPNQ